MRGGLVEGYEVVTFDDHRVGHVVDRQDGLLIVEHGTLHKVRHAVPEAFVEVDDEGQLVRTTLSKQMVEDSPKVLALRREIAAYYGLASGHRHPETEGAGALEPDDPAL